MRRILVLVALVVGLAGAAQAVTGPARMQRMLAEIECLEGFVGAGRVSVVSAGRSAGGQMIPLVVIHDPDVPIEDTKRIFIICRQHGDEPAPTEAVLSIIRAYFANPSETDLRLLQRVTFVIVPMMNPDGASRDKRRNGNNADLNRDWIRQTQPETRAVAAAVRKWRPSLILDDHELDWGDRRGNFLEVMGSKSGTESDVVSRDALFQAMVAGKLRVKGIPVRTVSDHDSRSAKLAHRYFPLWCGTPAMLLESRRSGSPACAFSQRIALHVTSVMTAARCLAGEDDALRQEIAQWCAQKRPAPTYRGGYRRGARRGR